MSLDNIIKFGIIRDVPVPAPSPTRYWAELDGNHIEFDITEARQAGHLYDTHPQFTSLFDYVVSLLIPSELTDEEYAAIVARRTTAGRER